ncbi:alpha/beta fold hydrolase [Nonomuraea sediminis]|uniref:alpha/beta fold hydrolase n=1 Tax=Nonomuraea sediminis TaxID=2835864 RepID=UPI001BDCD936|nr:alpha/beta hydrolase [Nonomuraea sediminis]
MTAFMLVHGAWHGAWAWDRVVPLLGRTLVPELSSGSQVGLADHVAEVVAALDAADEPVVLVGHSYGGLVVRQAADTRPGQVAHLVLVEGWAGPDGASLFSLAPAWFRDALQASAVDGELPPWPAVQVGITDPDDARWVEERMRPHPLRTFTDATRLTGAVDRIPGTGVYGIESRIPFADFVQALGYRPVPIVGPHDVMITDPALLADVLLKVRDQEVRALQ